ncbi:hypothetical protein EYZ11_007797 [Aspergillus tanneri]|uniref:Uncharacterized protein n=1 Tax=Aspergillus tanneri TaxID=1220188 RepID=A0A4S3JCA4_9EURO|nr:hypothetical protein EYZ11_007797 [Aspergillus tanneri]
MASKLILVTGANSGIGFQIIDIENDASIQSAFTEVQSKFGKLDALINNAGAQFDRSLAAGNLTVQEAWNQSWNVNTVGTQVLTSTFMPLLLQSPDPRLLFLTSGTSTLDNTALTANHNPPNGWPKSGISFAAYRSAKCGLNMLMREWYRMLREDGVKVWAISPGLLGTGISRDPEILEMGLVIRRLRVLLFEVC